MLLHIELDGQALIADVGFGEIADRRVGKSAQDEVHFPCAAMPQPVP